MYMYIEYLSSLSKTWQRLLKCAAHDTSAVIPHALMTLEFPCNCASTTVGDRNQCYSSSSWHYTCCKIVVQWHYSLLLSNIKWRPLTFVSLTFTDWPVCATAPLHVEWLLSRLRSCHVQLCTQQLVTSCTLCSSQIMRQGWFLLVVRSVQAARSINRAVKSQSKPTSFVLLLQLRILQLKVLTCDSVFYIWNNTVMT